MPFRKEWRVLQRLNRGQVKQAIEEYHQDSGLSRREARSVVSRLAHQRVLTGIHAAPAHCRHLGASTIIGLGDSAGPPGRNRRVGCEDRVLRDFSKRVVKRQTVLIHALANRLQRRKRAVASNPSSCGIWQSINTTSKRCSFSAASASSPLLTMW